ncbi:MAG: amino acid-binding protein [Lachnospiraceae bacterium]|nr:amino acid-binding protein [Lachnospiraceae bacterium]
MYINQLSVFLENREGRLEKVLDILKQNNINIISLSLADTSDFGMLRMIVSNPQVGKDALKAEGFSAMLTPVLAVKLSHQVGQLQVLLSEICKAGINIEYTYALATGNDDASIVIKPADLEKAAAVLEETGVELIRAAELNNY